MKTNPAQIVHEKTQDLSFSERESNLLEMGFSYKNFPAVHSSLTGIKNLLEHRKQTYDPEFSNNMIRMLENLRNGVELVELSLDTQQQYNLVDKRWVRDTHSLEAALAKGRLVMEIDIRQDKDGEFWVSHAVGASASVLPPLIHALSTKDMEKHGQRFSLEQSLKEFSRYAAMGHRLILELKSLGPNPEKFDVQVKKLKRMFKENSVEDGIAIASLSPAILMAVNKVMPETPLILNGGIVPGFSYTETGTKVINKLVDTDKKWRAFGNDPFGEIVFSASDELVIRADGEGTHTGYILTHLPQELLKTFRKQKLQGDKLGGLVSLSAINMAANALTCIGAKQTAHQLTNYYSDILKALGVGVMASTWGQSLSKIPGFSYLKPEKQIETLREQYGKNIVIYTKDPEETALQIKKNTGEKIQKTLS